MKTQSRASLIRSVALATRDNITESINALPYDALGDDYKRNPESACRKALRMTRGIKGVNRRLRAIDRLLGMHGVDYVVDCNDDWAFSYANAGDSYACTVILFASGTFRVSSCGDIVERNPNRYA